MRLFLFQRSSVAVWSRNQSFHITEQRKQIKLFVHVRCLLEEPVCFFQWPFTNKWSSSWSMNHYNRHYNVYKSALLLSGGAGFPHLTVDLTSIRSIGKKRFLHFHNRIRGYIGFWSHALAATGARRGAWAWSACQRRRRSRCCCRLQTTTIMPQSAQRSLQWPLHRTWSVQTQNSLFF